MTTLRRTEWGRWRRASRPRGHDFQLDAAVLRQAVLRDVQLGHQLDTQLTTRLADSAAAPLEIQHAVEAVADPEFLFKRFQVDVAGALSTARASWR